MSEYGPGGAHRHNTPYISVEEATKRALERSREWASRPETLETERQRKLDKERFERTKVGKDGKPESFIGPPNPYKPHRRG